MLKYIDMIRRNGIEFDYQKFICPHRLDKKNIKPKCDNKSRDNSKLWHTKFGIATQHEWFK